MGFLALAVACSLAIGMVFKWASVRQIDRLGLLTVNYVVAAALAALWVTTVGAERMAVSWPLAGLGVLTGVLFIGGFHLLGLATERSGMALSLGVMRLSVVVPAVASWAVWNEVPAAGQQAGLALACVAFALLAWSPRASAERQGAEMVLAALFVVGGTVDVLLKVFEEYFSARVDSAVYLAFVFATAGLLGAVGLMRRRRDTRRALRQRRLVYGWGVALGLVNYGSAVFLLEALARLPGTVAFPLNNVAIVVGSAILGVTIWKEHLTRQRIAGLGVALAALLLLGGTG